jgi:hypothetical protein
MVIAASITEEGGMNEKEIFGMIQNLGPFRALDSKPLDGPAQR